MAAEPSSVSELELGHVLFMDIVGYSKLLVDEQSDLSQQLSRIVRNTEQVISAEQKGKLIRLPTGDGMALIFFTSPEAPLNCALEISRALKKASPIKLRMGIHTGPVNAVADVNERENVAGGGINIAQRVMNCGDAGHILLSKRVAEDLGQYARWREHLHQLGPIEVKHGVKLDLVNFYSDDVGNAELPDKFKQATRDEKAKADRLAVTRRRKQILISAALLLVIASTIAFWTFFQGSSRRSSALPISDKSIAVLPFENLSKDEENAVFAGGVHREVLSNLAKVNDLKVISRTSVMGYKAGATRNLKEIAHELGVSHVVEGTVQRAGERVRVTAQLIDARTDSHVWAETYDRQLADIFAIQSEIAQRISDQLGAHLSTQERTALAKKPTQNAEAYELYTQAGALMDAATEDFAWEENQAKAIGLLEQAVAKDQQFSLAYSALAKASIQLYNASQDAKDLARANAALQEAHRLAPEAGETHLAQALFYYYGNKDFDRALATLEVAARSLPNNAQIFVIRGLLERRMGRWEESLRHFKQAIELNPKDREVYGLAAGGASTLRRYEEARRILDAAIAAFPAEADGSRAYKGFTYLREGDTAAARRELEKIQKKVDIASLWLGFAVPLFERNYAEAEEAMKDFAKDTAHPEDLFEPLPRLAVATKTVEKRRASLLAALARTNELIAKQPDSYVDLQNSALLNAALGNKEEAIRVAKRGVEFYPVSRDALNGPEQLNTLATIYAWTGEKDLAFETLFTLVKVPRGLAYGDLKLDPAWDNIRDDPRFGDLLAQAAKPLG